MFKKWSTTQTTKKYFKEGKDLRFQGEPQRAIEKLSKAIELDPMMLDAYLHRAIAYYEIGDLEHAFPDLDFVILHAPDTAAAYYWRSRAYMGIGKTDLALEDINEAIELDPDEPADPLFRGFIHLRRKEYDAALNDTTRAVELGFEEDGYRNRAIVFARMGNGQSAVDDWTRVIALNPDNAGAYCQRGILLEKAGQWERAISDLKMGLKNKNDLPESLKLESEKLLDKLEMRS